MSRIERVCFSFFGIWAPKTHPDGTESSVFSDEAYRLLAWLDTNSTYTCIGYEHCPTTGRPHWQGYAELKTRFRMTQLLSTKIGFRWNVRSCRGSQEDNDIYTSKEGSWIRHGQPKVSSQGKRNDLLAIRQTVATSGLRGVAASGASLQDIRYAEAIARYLEPERNFRPLIVYLQGNSGVGKSFLARTIARLFFPEATPYTKNSNSKWFEGYDADPVCILDDWRDSWWPLTEALNLFDQYPCRVECKGSSRQFLARVIIVTSVRDFQTVYKSVAGEDSWQIKRRFSRVITLGAGNFPRQKWTWTGSWGNNSPNFMSNAQEWSYEQSLLRLDRWLNEQSGNEGVYDSYDPSLVGRPEADATTYYSPTRRAFQLAHESLELRRDIYYRRAEEAACETYDDDVVNIGEDPVGPSSSLSKVEEW